LADNKRGFTALEDKSFFPMKRWTFLFTVAFLAISSLLSAKPPARGKKSATSVSKTLAFPVTGNRSRIRDVWGASRAGGIRKHKGIDIHAKRGTPIVAVCDGVIVEREHTMVGGKTLWLKSAEHGWKAYYAHLDKQLVKEGQHVRKGQVIGTVGNTGNARTTPSHLHYGIAGGNGWVNPLPYVKNSPKISAPAQYAAKKKAVTKKRRGKRR
jgi:murein DD-endopeptidase MepM/ murein hydrolase activator NlpD